MHEFFCNDAELFSTQEILNLVPHPIYLFTMTCSRQYSTFPLNAVEQLALAFAPSYNYVPEMNFSFPSSCIYQIGRLPI